MIIAITGTPGTGKTDVAKALAKLLGWWSVSLNDLAEEEDIYKGYDKERMCKVVDIERMRKEVNILAVSHKNIIIEAHYAHEMPSDVVVVLRTEPKVLRKRMIDKGFHTAKIAENMEAEMTDVIKEEAIALQKNVYETDNTSKTPDKVAKEIEDFIREQPFLNKDMKVPDDLVMEFRKPFGRVFKGEWDESAKKVVKELKGKKGLIVFVGDPTSYYLIRNGLKPDMIVTDGKEKRKKFGKKIPFRGQEMTVKNPSRHIT
ncbi:MAG: AAA family ATPase, partial [Candidatus Aenigmatarchaeota archaeon]